MYRQFSIPNWGSVKVSDAIRRLGSLEHMFWLLDQNRSCHFAVTAQIAGKASPDHWREALDRVQERHPLLSVCIEGSPGSLPCFRQMDAAPIPLRIVKGDPKTHWEREVGEELATPFDPTRAPLVRAVLIRAVETQPSFWSLTTRLPMGFRLLMRSGTCFPRSPANCSNRSPYHRLKRRY